ncbi:MAG: hypothetical protein H7251_16175 [Acetobacteraceae bacterium]|nr:hypothetical protein [Acetobacteraceae bacterium]
MNINPTPFGLPDAAPELARRFAMIMAGLGALVARRFLKMPHLVGFTGLLWGRLNRAVQRFYRALTVPAQAGAPRVRADRAATTRVRPEGLPRGRGWIVRELGWEAAAYLVQLENLLGEIATQHALAAAPGAGRVLRPICRMLGVPAASTPKLAPAALTPKLTSAALTQKVVANAPGGAAPEQGLIFSGG